MTQHRRRLPDAPPPPPPEDLDTPPEPTAEPLDAALMRLRGELAESAELAVSVYRIEGERNRQRTFCDAYALSDIEGEYSFQRRIRSDWGAGRYRLIAHDGRHYVLNREIVIAEDKRAEAAKPAPSPELAELRELVRQLVARDPGDSEARMLEKLRLYRELFAPAAAGDSSESFIRGVEFARQLGGAKPLEMMREILALVGGARELRDELAGAEGGASESLVGVGMELMRTIRQLAGAQGASAMPTLAVPSSLGELPAPLPHPAPAPAPPLDPRMQALRETVASLNTMARVEANPETVADLVYEKAPDEILAFLAENSWFEQLAALAPEVRPHAQWYALVRTQVLAIQKAEAESGGAG